MDVWEHVQGQGKVQFVLVLVLCWWGTGVDWRDSTIGLSLTNEMHVLIHSSRIMSCVWIVYHIMGWFVPESLALERTSPLILLLLIILCGCK